MAVADDIRMALLDGIAWQESLADAQGNDRDARRECLEQAKRYRAILKRRYGDGRSRFEQRTEGATTVTLAELRKRANSL